MMGLDERATWLLLGCAIGFVLGYIVRSLRDIKEELDEVEDILKKPERGEKGFMRYPIVADIMLILVVSITAWAAFASQQASNDVRHVSECATQYNMRLGETLASRDKAIRAGADAEIRLWARYNKLYKIAKSNPSKIPVLQERLNEAINTYRKSLSEIQKTRETHPYPNPDILQSCSDGKSTEEE